MPDAHARPLFEPRVRVLLLRVIVAVCLVAAADTTLRAFAERRFIPFARLHAAVAAGDRCLLLTGGSDMESAIDVPALRAVLVERGVVPCIASLSIGGTHKDVRFMALREYLEAGRVPSAMVVGFKGYDVADEIPETPGYQVGNNAALYAWGRVGDLAIYFPEWTFTAADNSLRFLLFRMTALGSYRQALWERVRSIEEQLGLSARGATNQFGFVEEFIAMEEARRLNALARQRSGSEHFSLARFNARAVELAARAGIASVHFVRLPALAATERAYFPDAAGAQRFDEVMQGLARRYHGRYLDLSREPWMQDSFLVDGLHYSKEGAANVTRVVGERLLAPGR